MRSIIQRKDPRGGRWNKKHLWTVTLLLILISAGVCFVIFEGVSAYMMRTMFHGPRIFQEDLYTSFSLVPNKVGVHTSREFQVRYKINEQGFRGRIVPLPKAPGKEHILILGDSFVFGIGVSEEEEVSSRLRELYRERADKNIEVINAGFAAGKSPDDAHAFLVSPRGKSLQADRVIEFLFVRNDPLDVKEHTWIEVDRDGYPLKVRSSVDFANDLSSRGPIPYHKKHPILAEINAVQLGMRAYFAFFELPERIKKIRAIQSEALKKGSVLSERFKKSLMGLNVNAAKQGVPLLLVIIPTRDQVFGIPDAYYDAFLSELKSYLQSTDIPHLTLDALTTGLTRIDYWPHDSHWKASGHQKVAQALYKNLETEI